MKETVVTLVEPAVGHIDTRCSDIAKRPNEFCLRHLRCVDKQLSGLDTVISVTYCVICDRLLFWDVSICAWH